MHKIQKYLAFKFIEFIAESRLPFRIQSSEVSIYVGDTDIDMQTAVAAGTRGVGMTTGNFDAETLAGAGAWRVLDDLNGVVGFTEE